MNHETIELACIGLGALALLIQSIVLLAIFVGMGKATKKIQEEIEDIRSSVMPVVKDTRELVDTARELFVRLGPKVESTVTDVSELTRSLRAQATNVEVTVEQVLERVRMQAGRLDTMFSGTLDAVDRATAYVTQTVSKPVRQLSGVLASIKAVVESLSGSRSKFHEPSVHDDKDMFV
jgi:methyl-accepting chemotaxis protein